MPVQTHGLNESLERKGLLPGKGGVFALLGGSCRKLSIATFWTKSLREKLC